MNRFIKISLLFVLVLSFLESRSQDKLVFLNGKEFEGKLIKKTNYEYTFLTKKDKQYVIDKYRLFSYIQDNKETIIYEFDTLSGNFLKVNDMKMFVYGERDAHKTYKNTFVNTLGLISGGVAGYFIHKEQSLVYLPYPLVYTIITLPFTTRVRQKKLKNLQYIKEAEYLRGYERVAKSKRTQSALKSSVIGLGVGFLISLIAN